MRLRKNSTRQQSLERGTWGGKLYIIIFSCYLVFKVDETDTIPRERFYCPFLTLREDKHTFNIPEIISDKNIYSVLSRSSIVLGI